MARFTTPGEFLAFQVGTQIINEFIGIPKGFHWVWKFHSAGTAWRLTFLFPCLSGFRLFEGGGNGLPSDRQDQEHH